MSAVRKMKTYESAGYETATLEKSAGWIPVVIVTAHGTARYEASVPVTAKVESTPVAKSIALFLAAPFIGLAYLVAMPFVALGVLAWLGVKAMLARAPVVRTIALATLAPCVGLAYIVATPVLGLGALVREGARRLTTS